jgi:hypothetical protein
MLFECLLRSYRSGASELAGSLYVRNNDSADAMADLGKATAAILSDLANLRAILGPSHSRVAEQMEAVELESRRRLKASEASATESRLNHSRFVLVTLASLEAEVTYLLSDRQASIKSRTERAFEHLKRSRSRQSPG